MGQLKATDRPILDQAESWALYDEVVRLQRTLQRLSLAEIRVRMARGQFVARMKIAHAAGSPPSQGVGTAPSLAEALVMALTDALDHPA